MRPLDGICLRQSTNPATTGCPLAVKNCRQTHARASPRGEWQSHSNGRRVVAASVLVTKLRCPGGGNRMKKKCQARFRESPSKPARSQEVCPFTGMKFIATKNTKVHENPFWRFPYWWQRPLVAAAPAIPAPWRSWRAWRGTISRKGRKAREGESWAQPFLWLFVTFRGSSKLPLTA